MDYILKRTIDPQTEPITVAELKAHLRVDWSDEDELLALLIKACREYAESYTARSFGTSTYHMWLKAFPSCRKPLRLPRLPVIAITAATVKDLVSGETTTIDESEFEVISGDDVCEVYHDWPNVPASGWATITFTAGFSVVPSAIKTGVLMHSAHLYRHREAVSELPLKEAPMGVNALYDSYLNYSTTI